MTCSTRGQGRLKSVEGQGNKLKMAKQDFYPNKYASAVVFVRVCSCKSNEHAHELNTHVENLVHAEHKENKQGKQTLILSKIYTGHYLIY